MGIEIRIDNRITEVLATIKGNLKNKMVEATNEVRNNTLETLSGKRQGREYYVPGTRTIYKASAPGEAPASATGQLRQSVDTDVSGDGLEGQVGTELDYGLYLEYGTRKQLEGMGMMGQEQVNLRGMAPRPWLSPSFEQSRDKIKKIFTTGYTSKPATAKTGTTWRQFTSERMGPYMKQYGGHAGAIRQIAAEWKEYKASRGGI